MSSAFVLLLVCSCHHSSLRTEEAILLVPYIDSNIVCVSVSLLFSVVKFVYVWLA